MWTWIGIAVGYVLMIGGFRVIGGVGSAMDAIRGWGSSVTGSRPSPSSG